MPPYTPPQAILLPGASPDPHDYFWFADTASHLSAQGYAVYWPTLPHPRTPDLQSSLEFLSSDLPLLDDRSIVIAHSQGCPLALSVLTHVTVHLAHAVLVAGYYDWIPGAAQLNAMLPPDGFAWATIRAHCSHFTLINSDNDPWGCTDIFAGPAAGALSAHQIVALGQRHLGSLTPNQPYAHLPLVKRIFAPPPPPALTPGRPPPPGRYYRHASAQPYPIPTLTH